MSGTASEEATRAALHMREVERQSRQALDEIDHAIAEVSKLMDRGETDDQ